MHEKPFAVEYYYKVKWGYADEFIRLYRKNHYPILKHQMELGRILSVTADRPRFHSSEESRWDYRITIVWRNIQYLNDGFDEVKVARDLFSDFETFRKEEQRRFELLLAHWDVPIDEVELEVG